jgi:hypothetical protein
MQDRWLRLVTHTEWGKEAKGKHHEGPPAGRLIVSSRPSRQCLIGKLRRVSFPGSEIMFPACAAPARHFLLFCLTPSPTSLLFGGVVLA